MSKTEPKYAPIIKAPDMAYIVSQQCKTIVHDMHSAADKLLESLDQLLPEPAAAPEKPKKEDLLKTESAKIFRQDGHRH